VLAGLADAAALVVGLDGKTVRGARTKDGEGTAPAGGDDLRVRAVLARKTWTTKSQTSMYYIMSALSPCAKTPQRLRAGSSAQVSPPSATPPSPCCGLAGFTSTAPG
jgi:hypothetical protein